MDHKFIIEWLEDIPAYRRMVDTGILVALEVGQFMLANVHHLSPQGLLGLPRSRTRKRIVGGNKRNNNKKSEDERLITEIGADG